MQSKSKSAKQEKKGKILKRPEIKKIRDHRMELIDQLFYIKFIEYS